MHTSRLTFHTAAVLPLLPPPPDVNRRGFKCTYDRGILHLYFNFKRARYRR
jgi:hypothetical protein